MSFVLMSHLESSQTLQISQLSHVVSATISTHIDAASASLHTHASIHARRYTIALLEVATAYSDVPSIPVYSEKIVVAHPIKRKVVAVIQHQPDYRN